MLNFFEILKCVKKLKLQAAPIHYVRSGNEQLYHQKIYNGTTLFSSTRLFVYFLRFLDLAICLAENFNSKVQPLTLI